MTRPPLPERLTIDTHGPLDGRVSVPGSKSITNRALLLAALASGESRLSGGLESDDTVVMRAALDAMGIGLKTSSTSTGDGADENWIVNGRGGHFVPHICRIPSGSRR